MVPSARILVYGYDIKLEGSNSITSIIDLSKALLQQVKTVREDSMVLPSKITRYLYLLIRLQLGHRPLIFIGHCLGGLVIKQVCSEYEHCLVQLI